MKDRTSSGKTRRRTPKAYYEIHDCIDGYVCRRATLKACKALLAKHAGKPFWGDGPWFVFKVTRQRVYKHCVKEQRT